MNINWTQDNIYTSDMSTKAREYERVKGTNMWNKAQNPMQNGVVPRPAYASMFSSPNFEGDSNNVMNMAGNQVSPNSFIHNNMQPFFGGSVKQSTRFDAFESKLERFTGRSDLTMHKKEVPSFFEPTPGINNTCGMQNQTEFYIDNLQLPKLRNNDFPIEKEYIGKGLGQGYTSTPTGGFQQLETLQYAMPKNVDELRTCTNPKVVYELPIQGPKQGIAQRGLIGKFEKNRTEKFFEQSPDMWLRTTGAVIKDTNRSIQNVKPTSRVETHVEYKGGASSGERSGQGSKDDYGRIAVTAKPNEREATTEATVLTNLTSIVKAIVSPIIDVFRHTPKEYTIDSARPYGNMQAQIPEKPTLYDPVTGKMRTTIKETGLYDASDLGTSKPQIPEKPTLYDPVTGIMRTTIKETLIHDTDIGNIKAGDKTNAYIMDDAKKTVRQTLPCTETRRNVNSHTYRVTVYNVDAIAKKTIRETTPCSANELGFIGGDTSRKTGAYSVIDVEMPNTQKQFISDYEYEGIASSVSDFRQTSTEATDNAEIDGTREFLNMNAGRTPNAGGKYTGLDADQIEMESKRLISDDLAPRTVGNVSRVVGNEVKPVESCEVTKPSIKFDGESERLDPKILKNLDSNPYAININPVI